MKVCTTSIPIIKDRRSKWLHDNFDLSIDLNNSFIDVWIVSTCEVVRIIGVFKQRTNLSYYIINCLVGFLFLDCIKSSQRVARYVKRVVLRNEQPIWQRPWTQKLPSFSKFYTIRNIFDHSNPCIGYVQYKC